MTDRELRKLNRLELLELLLDVSTKNHELEEKVKQLSNENEIARSIENLSVITKQADDILGHANSLVDILQNSSRNVSQNDATSENADRFPADSSKKHTDRNLYTRLLNFYIKNNNAVELLDDELKNDIRNRIKEIAEKRKNNH